MIDINMHGKYYTASSRMYSDHVKPFITLEISTNNGSVTCYFHDIEDAKRIAQASLELLANFQKMEKSNAHSAA